MSYNHSLKLECITLIPPLLSATSADPFVNAQANFGIQDETVKHFLLFCSKYSIERSKPCNLLQGNKLQLNTQDILDQHSTSESY